jgi:hypothetical protein
MDYQKTVDPLELAALYSVYNLKMVDALREFRRVRKESADMVDDNNKPISAVKADIFADALPQAHEYELARAHVSNITIMLDSLKHGVN